MEKPKPATEPFLTRPDGLSPELKELYLARNCACLELAYFISDCILQQTDVSPTLYPPTTIPSRPMEEDEWEIVIKKDPHARSSNVRLYIQWHPHSKRANDVVHLKIQANAATRFGAQIREYLIKHLFPALGIEVETPPPPVEIRKETASTIELKDPAVLAEIKERIRALTEAHNKFITAREKEKHGSLT
ncbi:hypothetical protein IPG41_02400 [Candidatus Peregrinibacteria bacterium]|nr:MAG: hypothetical protein IPG41_02400 [Candidatus Peregrinibacteria bacterium]